MSSQIEDRSKDEPAGDAHANAEGHQDLREERIRVTTERAKRTRAHLRQFREGQFEFDPQAQPLYDPEGTAENRDLLVHHDVLVIAPKGVHGGDEFFRVPVRKIAGAEDGGHAAPVGQYRDPPELTDAYDHGQRKALSSARPADWGSLVARGRERGPAFSTLPVKPEPAASSATTCYLVNAQNVNYHNAWTSDPWNGAWGSAQLPTAPGAHDISVEALLAGPRGKVWRLRFDSIDQWPLGERLAFSIPGVDSPVALEVESVDLQSQGELWNQLRNGCAMGRAMFEDGATGRVLPLLNITTLLPKSSVEAVAPSEKAAPAVTGTWDFKWPRGTQIRVAFQRPRDLSPREFDLARAQVRALAQRWQDAVRNRLGSGAPEFFKAGIDFAFSDDWILDPPMGSSFSPGSEHRSPFLPNDKAAFEYDVLITLADLPLHIVDPFALTPAGSHRIVLPASLLGSYARRADHGTPTMFLGRFGNSIGQGLSLNEHLELPIAQYSIVHELGHALGLPHEHQNPNYAPATFRPMNELLDSIRQRFGLGPDELTAEEARELIIEPWGGSREFSDWAEPSVTLYELESVMAYPLGDLLVPRQLTPPRDLITHPTAVDVDNLIRMYRAREARAALATAAE